MDEHGSKDDAVKPDRTCEVIEQTDAIRIREYSDGTIRTDHLFVAEDVADVLQGW